MYAETAGTNANSVFVKNTSTRTATGGESAGTWSTANFRNTNAGGSAPYDYLEGQTRANSGTVVLGPGAGLTVLCAQASGTTHFILDVTGYFQ